LFSIESSIAARIGRLSREVHTDAVRRPARKRRRGSTIATSL
jgi:hypothetical protein